MATIDLRECERIFVTYLQLFVAGVVLQDVNVREGHTSKFESSVRASHVEDTFFGRRLTSRQCVLLMDL